MDGNKLKFVSVDWNMTVPVFINGKLSNFRFLSLPPDYQINQFVWFDLLSKIISSHFAVIPIKDIKTSPTPSQRTLSQHVTNPPQFRLYKRHTRGHNRPKICKFDFAWPPHHTCSRPPPTPSVFIVVLLVWWRRKDQNKDGVPNPFPHTYMFVCVCVGKFAWILLLLLLFLSQQAAGGGGCQRLSRAERPSLRHPKTKGGLQVKACPDDPLHQTVGRSVFWSGRLLGCAGRQLGRKKKTNQTDTDLRRESAYCVLFLLLRTTLRVELASAIGLWWWWASFYVNWLSALR